MSASGTWPPLERSHERRLLAATVITVVGCKAKITFDTSMPDGTPRKLLDVSRRARLGWRASTPLREGIARAYAAAPFNS